MSTILLSIKPEYVSKILDGTKKYEFRRNLAQEKVTKILIYSTAPVMRVVGEAEVIDTISLKPSPLWEATKEAAGISRANFRAYFQGCQLAHAYKLGKIVQYEVPKTLLHYGIIQPPQSFVYIERKTDKILSIEDK